MTRLILFAVLLTTFVNCRQLERITTTTTERIDSVQVQLPIAGHVLDVPAWLSDSLIVEDDRVRVRVYVVPDSVVSADGEGAVVHGVVDGGRVSDAVRKVRIVAEVKPDTQTVKVAEKTITTERQEVVVEKRLPEWVKYLLGWLIGTLIVVILLAKFRP